MENAQIGKGGNYKFCLHNLLNRNREYLADCYLENRITCEKTKFQKREREWERQRNLDLRINKKWINSTPNCEAFSSFEGVSSDHRIVSSKIHQGRRRNTTQTVKASLYDWCSLTRHLTEIFRMTNMKFCCCPYRSSSRVYSNQTKTQI